MKKILLLGLFAMACGPFSIVSAEETLDASALVEAAGKSAACRQSQKTGVTVDILNCQSDQREAAEKALNHNYKLAMKATNNKKLLREFQRQWIKDREKYCAQVALPTYGGTMSSINVSACFINWTVERSEQLAAIADYGDILDSPVIPYGK